MPKIILDNWLGGLTTLERLADRNTFFEGKGIDIFRTPGFLKPGTAYTKVTKSDDTPAIIVGGIQDMVARLANDAAYFIDDTKLYEMSSVSNETWNANFDGSAHYYKAITNSTGNPDENLGAVLKLYNISGNERLFFAYRSSVIGGAIGMYDFSGTGGFTLVYIGDGGTKNYDLAVCQPDMEEWNSYLWIGAGRYVHRYDGLNDTFSSQQLDLGPEWFVTKLIATKNYLLVCADKGSAAEPKYKRETAIFVWDGVNSTFLQKIPVKNFIITSGINYNEVVYLFGARKHIGSSDPAGAVFILEEGGPKNIYKLSTIVSATETAVPYIQRNGVDVYDNRLMFGGKGSPYIFSLGSPTEDFQKVLTMPHTPEGTQRITCVKNLGHTKFYVASQKSDPIYYIDKFTTGNDTASYRHSFVDFGQKVRVNYIKFYFKELASGDSVTPNINLDYSTTNITLKDPKDNATIAYANDGAVTSKKFKVGRDCHAIRPVLTWGAGGVAFSKIVIDYDFLPDDN